jgi:hypothetical protein
MNNNLKDVLDGLMIDASAADVEKLSSAIIKECAWLEDKWTDSGKFATFGNRLLDHFGVEKKI